MGEDSPSLNQADRAGARRRVSVVKSALIGGAVAVLVPGAVVFIWAWVTGEVYSSGQTATRRPPPMSLGAAGEALLFAYICTLLLGLPLCALGAIGGVVAALFQRARQSE